MKTYNFLTFFLLVIITFISFFVVACEQEENERDITAKEVPQAVLHAFNQVYPGAIIKSYAEEIENGQKFYEVSCTYEGRNIDALYHPDGSVAAIEAVIPVSQLPDAIKQRFAEEFKNDTINLTEKIEKEDEVFYELKAMNNYNGERYELIYSEAGKLVEKEGMKREEKENNVESEED